MGYTHYFYRVEKLDKKKWANVIVDCKKVCEKSGANIQFENDNNSPPIFSNKLIRFNGIGDNGHETFFIEQKFSINKNFVQTHDKDKNKHFSFCKTAEKPYDICVVSCLIILKHYYQDDIILGSDGDNDDWKDGKELVQKVLGYGDNFKLRGDEKT